MVSTMDLNASPQPEEDEEPYVRHLEDYSSRDERIESAVEIARRVLLIFYALHNQC